MLGIHRLHRGNLYPPLLRQQLQCTHLAVAIFRADDMFHVFLFINFTLCLITGNMTSLCNQRRQRRESRAESRGRQTTLSFSLSLQVMLLLLAHAHSLCLKFGACARHALVKPLCGGIHYVCILARVKGFGRNHDNFINSYSSFVQRCQKVFILQYHIYIFCLG